MKKITGFLVPLLLIIAIFSSIVWYLFVYDRVFTRDFLLSQARYNDLYGNSRLSAWFYDMAYDFSGKDENVAIELANQYKKEGNFTKAEYTLSSAINNGGTVELYTALCKTYVEQDKLLDAVNMLANITDPEMKTQLEILRPTAPVVNYEPGFYSQYIDVELESSSGTVYYTTDGDYPSIAGSSYDKGIALEAGETMIYAISVDESGLVSPITIVSYTIGGVIEPAVFTDKTMENAIREAIGAAQDEIVYTNELWDIAEFTVPSGVSSYKDLALMPYLRTLTIQEHQMDTLSDLSSLTVLETLNLKGCRFPAEELSVLAKITTLSNLDLTDCALSTIEGLTGLENLTHLNLSANTLRNLDPIRSMKSLKELNMQHNALTSLDAMAELADLEKLDISYNAVTSLSPLSNCLKLNWLDASNNKLDSVSGADKLPLLNYLILNHNALTSVSSLANCTELVELGIANNKLTDISALSALVKLDVLDFAYNEVVTLPQWPDNAVLRVIDGSYNKLTSIDSLSNLEQIGYVYMDYNELTSVDALADCYRLIQVNVYGNEIEEVGSLTEHDIIVNYDPT